MIRFSGLKGCPHAVFYDLLVLRLDAEALQRVISRPFIVNN